MCYRSKESQITPHMGSLNCTGDISAVCGHLGAPEITLRSANAGFI